MPVVGCDEISSPSGPDTAILQSLSIDPTSVEFNEGSPPDSTITVSLSLTTTNRAQNELIYSVTNNGESLTEGSFEQQNDTDYRAEFSLTISSSLSTNLTVYAFESGNSSGELIRGNITLKGFSTSPPELVEAFNTEEVTIPEDGRRRVDFFARVVHPDNQELIDRVIFYMIDQQDNPVGGKFELFDDGVFNETSGRIDEAESDSLYSRAFFVEPDNNPAEISVFYYAQGVDGQSSDTLETQLRILE